MVNQRTVKVIVSKYLRGIRGQVPIDQAFLVGSWADGKASKDSDVDVLLVSKRFAKMDPDERLRILYKNTVGFDLDLHLHAVTEKELKSASELTSLGAMKRGIKISLQP